MKSNRVTFAGQVGLVGQTGSTSLPPHPLTKRHTAPLGQVVAAGIFFAGSVTGAGINAGVVAAGFFFAGSVTGIVFGTLIVAAIFFLFLCLCVRTPNCFLLSWALVAANMCVCEIAAMN